MAVADGEVTKGANERQTWVTAVPVFFFIYVSERLFSFFQDRNQSE